MPLKKSLVLITAARNEAEYIGKTIRSVLDQSHPPTKWIIISDGSVDNTDSIIRYFAKDFKIIEYIRREASGSNRNFASKVYALNEGYERIKGLNYDYIGHIDADLSFDKKYFEEVLNRFLIFPRMGLAGGYVYEEFNGVFRSRKSNSPRSVAGGTQIFRRECYEIIGRFVPMEFGGEDSIAEIRARMTGWEVKAFPELIVYHHKKSLEGRDALRRVFREGMMDYCMGSHPLFELLKCFRRIPEKPYLSGSILRMAGFLYFFLKKEKRAVSKEFVDFLQKEQLRRIKKLGRRNHG